MEDPVPGVVVAMEINVVAVVTVPEVQIVRTTAVATVTDQPAPKKAKFTFGQWLKPSAIPATPAPAATTPATPAATPAPAATPVATLAPAATPATPAPAATPAVHCAIIVHKDENGEELGTVKFYTLVYQTPVGEDTS